MKTTGMQWTGLLRINHHLIGKGVDTHQHHVSEMGIDENAIASRITRHKHREGNSKDQINILIAVMNTKEKSDVLCWTALNGTVQAVSGQSNMNIDSPLSNNWLNAF